MVIYKIITSVDSGSLYEDLKKYPEFEPYGDPFIIKSERLNCICQPLIRVEYKDIIFKALYDSLM